MTNKDNLETDLSMSRERFIDLVPESSDISIIILKGHLVVEEMLNEILKSHCVDYKALLEENLTFHQKACVAKSFMSSVGIVYFPSIFFLNRLRNDLAHNIDSTKRNHLIASFIHNSRSLFGEKYNETETLEGKLRNAVCHAINGLGISEGLSLIWLEKANKAISRGRQKASFVPHYAFCRR